MRIGFLGLGNMGRPMARNLLELGHTVTVYSRTQGKAADLIAKGAKEAATVAEAVADVEVAITMLPDDAALAAVVSGPAGLLESLPSQSIHLCMSTIGVETSAGLAVAHAGAGQGYVAAPVFGKASDAASRQIWIMAGGPEPQVNRCLPIFIALGRGLTRVGPKAALAHALKQGCNALADELMETTPGILASCERAQVAPADYLRFLGSAIFKIPLVEVLEEALLPPLPDPADLSMDLVASEMLAAALQASAEPAKASPATDRPSARQKNGRPQGRGRHKQADQSRNRRAGLGPESKVVAERRQASAASPTSVSGRDPAPGAGTLEARKEPHPVPPQPAMKMAKPVEPLKTAAPVVPLSPVKRAPGTVPGEARERAVPRESQAAEPPCLDPSCMFTAMEGDRQLMLDLNMTSHFELAKGRVWVWSRGRRYGTSWRKLGEVELAFQHTLFLLIQRHVLLRPEAVLDLRNTFGGGAKARVGGDMELDVSRAAAPRLRLLLGM